MANTPKRKQRKISQPSSNSLAGKLIYFSGLENDELCHDLDQKLLLVSEDQYESEPHYSSFYVFGYIINQPASKNLREHFGKMGKIIHHDLQQIEAMGSDSVFQAQNQLSFITRKLTGDHPAKTDFKAFSVFEHEDLESAAETCRKLIERKLDFITSYSFVIIDHDQLLELIQLGYAKVRDADPEIVFEKTAASRTYKAFPGEFDFNF